MKHIWPYLFLMFFPLIQIHSAESVFEEDQGSSLSQTNPIITIREIVNKTNSQLTLTWSNGRRIFLEPGDSIHYSLHIPLIYNAKKNQLEQAQRLMLSSSNGIQIIFNKIAKRLTANGATLEAIILTGKKDSADYNVLLFYASKPGKKIKPIQIHTFTVDKSRAPTYNDKHDTFECKIIFTRDNRVTINLYHKKTKDSLKTKAKKIGKKLYRKP